MRKCVYYLIVFLTIFMVPMYLYADYFGATDVYAWILFFLGVFLLFAERLEWGMLLMAFISTCLSPMSLFYTVCMSAALLFYRAVQKGEKKVFVFGGRGNLNGNDRIFYCVYSRVFYERCTTDTFLA